MSKKLFIIFFSLISIYTIGEEAPQLSLGNIGIAFSENKPVLTPTIEESISKSEIYILQTVPKDEPLIKIAYPLEESNFEKVFGRKP